MTAARPLTLDVPGWLSRTATPHDGVDLIRLQLHFDPALPMQVQAYVTPAPDYVLSPQPWLFDRSLLRDAVMGDLADQGKDSVAGEEGFITIGLMRARKQHRHDLVAFRFPTSEGDRYVGVLPDKVLGFVIAMYLAVPSDAEHVDVDAWLSELEA